MFATSLRGCRDDLQVVTDGVEAIPTSDLAATYADGSAALRDALDAPDPESTCPTGLGPMPPAVVGRLRTVEALVHGWDVSRAANLAWTVDDAVVERAHRSSVTLLDRLPPGRTPFAPPREVASDAPAMHRLVALLGRRPDGPGSPQA